MAIALWLNHLERLVSRWSSNRDGLVCFPLNLPPLTAGLRSFEAQDETGGMVLLLWDPASPYRCGCVSPLSLALSMHVCNMHCVYIYVSVSPNPSVSAIPAKLTRFSALTSDRKGEIQCLAINTGVCVNQQAWMLRARFSLRCSERESWWTLCWLLVVSYRSTTGITFWPSSPGLISRGLLAEYGYYSGVKLKPTVSREHTFHAWLLGFLNRIE